MSSNSLDERRCYFQGPLNWHLSVWIHDTNLKIQVVSNTPNCACKIRIFRYDDCLLVLAIKAISQESRRKVYVRPLLFSIYDINVFGQSFHRTSQRPILDPRFEHPIVDLEAGQGM